ncbi:MAG: hypothetical protein HC884_05960 [Chloroflexaceae bacterium]|nr:hypothetical protein [Chloroflexaceae bacterium]
MTTRYLVLFDADKIKDYVFATGRLKEIRGASEQVRQLTDPEPIKTLFCRCLGRPLDVWQEGVPEGLIYAGGGAGALLVANQDDAQTFCTELERTYRRTTRSATLSAICVPVEAGPEQEAEALALAARRLAHRKASRCTAEHIPGGGAFAFAIRTGAIRQVTGLSPAEGDPENPNNSRPPVRTSEGKTNPPATRTRSGNSFWST